MRTSTRCHSLALALTLVLVAAAPRADAPAPAPTAFESFVADPNVVVEFEQWAGTVASADARVSVTALAGHDSADASRRMRGARFTMEDNAGSDSVHLDESQFAALLRDLAQVEAGKARLRSESGAPYRVHGTASCWMPQRPMRILCPSYRIGPDWAGMLLGAYGGRTFEFPDREPAELAALIARAAALLEARPAPN